MKPGERSLKSSYKFSNRSALGPAAGMQTVLLHTAFNTRLSMHFDIWCGPLRLVMLVMNLCLQICQENGLVPIVEPEVTLGPGERFTHIMIVTFAAGTPAP